MTETIIKGRGPNLLIVFSLSNKFALIKESVKINATNKMSLQISWVVSLHEVLNPKTCYINNH